MSCISNKNFQLSILSKLRKELLKFKWLKTHRALRPLTQKERWLSFQISTQEHQIFVDQVFFGTKSPQALEGAHKANLLRKERCGVRIIISRLNNEKFKILGKLGKYPRKPMILENLEVAPPAIEMVA
jgi:hypothetical protein